MAPEHRLHWLTLVFEMGKSVRSLVLPIAILLIAQRDRSGPARLAIPLGLVAISAVVGIARYATFRYRYEPTEMVIRSGLLFRNERHIPYERIHNIDATQRPLHRLFDVTVVQLQTASGGEAEASLEVLPLRALDAMRERVAAGRAAVSAPPAIPVDAALPAEPVAAPARELLHLGPRDLILAGFIENRGLVLIAAAIGALTQFDELTRPMIEFLVERIPALAGADPSRWIAGGLTPSMIGGAALFVLLVLALVRVLSTVWALVRLHDFRLTLVGHELRSEFGLLTRVMTTVPLHRVQTVTVLETMLHRRTGTVAVSVTTAGGSVGKGVARRERLAPILPRVRLAEVLEILHPGMDLDRVEWHGAAPRAFRRVVRWSVVTAVLLGAASAMALGWWAVPVTAALVALAIRRDRGRMQQLGWGEVMDGVAMRRGWLRRVIRIVRFDRVQVVEFNDDSFDRRWGMAEVAIDAAGGAAGWRVPLLARDDAEQLRGMVARRMAATEFRW